METKDLVLMDNRGSSSSPDVIQVHQHQPPQHQQQHQQQQQQQQPLSRDSLTPQNDLNPSPKQLHMSLKRARENGDMNTDVSALRDDMDSTNHRHSHPTNRPTPTVNHNHTSGVASPAPKKLLIITLYPASLGWKSGTSHKYLVQKHGGRWDRIKAEISISAALRDKNPATICVEGDLSQDEIHSLFVKAISEGVPIRLCRLFETPQKNHPSDSNSKHSTTNTPTTTNANTTHTTSTTPNVSGGKENEKKNDQHEESTLIHVQQPSYHVDDQIYTVREENCAVCLKTQKELSASSTNGLRQCSKCKVRKYCSRECQVKDWVKHKIPCERSARALETSREYSVSKCGFNHSSSPVYKLFMSRHTSKRIADFEQEVCRLNSNIRKMARRLAASRVPVGGDSLVGLDFVPFATEEGDDSDSECINKTTTTTRETSTHDTTELNQRDHQQQRQHASVCCKTESHNWSRIYPCFQ